MNFKTTLALVLAAVIVAVVAYINPFKSKEEDRPDPPWFYQVGMDDIEVIEVTHRADQVRFLKTPEGTWSFVDPSGIPPSYTRWGGMTLIFSGPQTSRELAEGTTTRIADINRADYGLEDPHTIVDVGLTDNRWIEFRLGDKTLDGKRVYAEVIGFEELFLIAGTWGDVVARLAAEPPLPKWYIKRDPLSIEEVNVYRTDPASGEQTWVSIEQKDGAWSVNDFAESRTASAKTAVGVAVEGYDDTEGSRSRGLRIAIADAPDPVPAGDSLVYKVVVSNGRAQPALNVSVRGRLPRGVAFQSARGSGLDSEKTKWSAQVDDRGARSNVDLIVASDPSAEDGPLLKLEDTVESELLGDRQLPEEILSLFEAPKWTWEIGVLPAGGSTTLEISVAVVATVEDEHVLTVTATVESDTPADAARLEEIMPLFAGPPGVSVAVPVVDDGDYTPYGITDEGTAIEIRFSGRTDRGTKYIDGILLRVGSKASEGPGYYGKSESDFSRQPVLLLDADWTEALLSLFDDIPYAREVSTEGSAKAN